MDHATSKYVLGVARAPGSGQFPTTDQSAMRIPSEWPTNQTALRRHRGDRVAINGNLNADNQKHLEELGRSIEASSSSKYRQ
jgi:hypothetical protein